jgi:hypothetical protein
MNGWETHKLKSSYASMADNFQIINFLATVLLLTYLLCTVIPIDSWGHTERTFEMVDAIWCYKADYYPAADLDYPLCPDDSFETEICNRDFTDKNRMNEVVEDLKQMGAEFICVCPDYRHHKGYDYPHIAVTFPDEEQIIQCARKYTGGSYSAPVGAGPFKKWCLAAK